MAIIDRTSDVLRYHEKIISASSQTGILILALSILAYRGDLLSWEIALLGLLVGHGLCILAICCVFYSLIVYDSSGKSLTGESGVLVAICAVPVIMGFQMVGVSGLQAPLINDISTDINDPPAFKSATLLRTSNDNGVSYPAGDYGANQLQAYPDLTSVHLDVSADVAYRSARYIVSLRGWQVMIADQAQGKIEAVVTTLVMGFKDDVAIRIRALDSQRSVLDIRSSSREGAGDLGANARRIRKFLVNFESVLIKQQNDLKYSAVRVDTVPAAT
jgi:uncharacterized protein (DUF1499 family)